MTTGADDAAHRVLAVTYGGGHVAMCIPVIRALQRANVRVDVLALTTARADCDAAGIASFGFRDLLDLSDAGQALLHGRRLAAGMSHPKIAREETEAYLGLNYLELEARYGVEDARMHFERRGRQAFLPVELMRRLIRRGKYHLVVATNSPRAERAAILAAGMEGVRSVCMVDLLASTESEWIAEPGYASKVCVISLHVMRSLQVRGRPDDDFVVTGNPAFDGLLHQADGFDRQSWRARRGWSEADWVILWASQPERGVHPVSGAVGNEQLPRDVDAALLASHAHHPEWRLVFRAHPSENHQWADLPSRVEVSGSGDDLNSLLLGVDCVITMSSTVGLQAALVGTRVVQLQCSIFSGDLPLAAMGLALAAKDIASLDGALNDVRNGAAVSQGHVLQSDGLAAERISSLAQELLEPS